MIRRRQTATDTIERTDPVTTEKPDTVTTELPRWQQPTTFASRRAESAARGELDRPQRLVSLGWTRQALQTYSRDPKNPVSTRYVDFEQLYDLDHPLKRYRRFRNGMIEPYDYSTGKNDESTPLGTFDPKGPNAAGAFSAWPSSGQADRHERIG